MLAARLSAFGASGRGAAMEPFVWGGSPGVALEAPGMGNTCAHGDIAPDEEVRSGERDAAVREQADRIEQLQLALRWVAYGGKKEIDIASEWVVYTVVQLR